MPVDENGGTEGLTLFHSRVREFRVYECKKEMEEIVVERGDGEGRLFGEKIRLVSYWEGKRRMAEGGIYRVV